MGQGGLATQIWYSSSVVRRFVIFTLILFTGVVAFGSIAFRPESAPAATWWPAAGIAVVAVLASRGYRVVTAAGVMIATVVANALLGRELGLALGFGLGNGIEAYLVALLVSRGGPEARLDTVRDVGRLLVAVLAGAMVFAMIGSVTAAVVVGAAPGLNFILLLTSHVSALLVVTPLALVSRRLRQRVRPVEVAVQVVCFLAVILFVFWPGNSLPLSFLPLAVLLWAAFRLPMILVAIEVVAMALIAVRLTYRGGGPFADFAVTDPIAAVLLLQLFLALYASAALFVSSARNDWGAVVVQLSAREALLRGGIVSSEIGILIAEVVDGDRLRVVGVNPAALSALGRASMPPTWAVAGIRVGDKHPVLGLPELDALIVRGRSGRVEVEAQERRFDVDVAVHEGAVGARVFTVVFTDVTQRDERERRAITAAAQLRDLNAQKDGFISSVSHELRTPVTSILGFVEDLEDAALGPRERVAAEVIGRNARRLADVIEDVLELSKLSSGAAIARPAAPVDVALLARQCAQDATGLAPRRGIEMIVDVPDEPVIMTTIAADLTRVLANVLSNAVKFSDDHGRVRIALAAHGEGWRIVVSDEGMGIPPEQLDYVWGRFSRVQDDRHREIAGTGLGLPIVRELVEGRLGGRVRLESDGVSGTTVVIDLPPTLVDQSAGVDGGPQRTPAAETAQTGAA